MIECRCENCRSLLGTDLVGTVKIKCYKANCKKLNIFTSEKQTGPDQQTFIKDYEKTADSPHDFNSNAS
jgi:hypothetical protein